MADENGNVKDVMQFFGFEKVVDFRKEWSVLSESEQTWFKNEVSKVIG